jgi:serine/threonine-protein kinase ATR
MTPDKIRELYEDVSVSLPPQDQGKANYCLATMIDQQVQSYIEQCFGAARSRDEIRNKNGRTGRDTTNTSVTEKFGAALTPKAITDFLKANIPQVLQNYFRSISKSGKYIHEVVPSILRLSFDLGDDIETKSLWDQLGTNQKNYILQIIKESMAGAMELPEYVWLNSITQLTSRIDQSDKTHTLSGVLFKLIEKSIKKFPQESLWHLMSVHNSTISGRQRKFEELWGSLAITDDLARQKQDFVTITCSLIKFCQESTARIGVRGRNDTAEYLCPDLRRELKRTKLLLPTSETLIHKGNHRVMRIQEMENKIQIMRSLQAPKKIGVLADTGNIFHYLCKQDDDLRKDMRMMEFAGFVNLILKNNRRCRERELQLKTFAVILLNEKCGIIEWVEQTECLGQIVETLYKENGIEVNRSKFKTDCEKAQEKGGDEAVAYFEKQILRKYPPVMHLWFAKKSQTRWFPARLLYTRSTALWSTVGFFVGLGDRHAENVLYQDSGNCVHVDFNCMFDRAKSLKVAERVPFRLTQNIIDGMGALGCSGLFTKTCELVVETLRGKKQRLLSVLRPFLYDPLLEWKASGGELLANIVLKEVGRRLAGISEDRSTINSPECTVENLISQATNKENLVQMFHGWQSFI